MNKVVEIPVKGGRLLFAAPGLSSTGPEAYGAVSPLEQASGAFESALEMARTLGNRMAEELSTIRCESAEVSFGLTLSAKGSFIVAEASAQAAIQIKLVLKPRVDD